MGDDCLVDPDPPSDRDSELAEERLEKRPARKRAPAAKGKLAPKEGLVAARGGGQVAPKPPPEAKPAADYRYDPDPQLKELLESEFFKSGAWKNTAKPPPEANAAKEAKPPEAKPKRQRKAPRQRNSDEAPVMHRPDFYSSVMIV